MGEGCCAVKGSSVKKGSDGPHQSMDILRGFFLILFLERNGCCHHVRRRARGRGWKKMTRGGVESGWRGGGGRGSGEVR